jgi:cell division protein FtsQ
MSAALPTPLDVRLMNATASALFVALAALGLAAVLWWGLRHPMFSIVAIQVQGDLTHNNAVTLRANVAHRLSGNLFTLDLAAARTAFEGVPWVRKALVRREFPNRLNVQLQEHLPVAYWGDEGESLLLNTFGEVFEANLGDVEADKLPRLSGPQGQSAQLLAMYRQLLPVFEPLDAAIEQLELTDRGSWRVQLDSGTAMELGRGTAQEVLERTRRYVSTVSQATALYRRKPDSVESAWHGKEYKDLVVGLDIGTAKVMVVVAEVMPGGELKLAGLGVAPSHGLKRGVVVNIDATVQQHPAGPERGRADGRLQDHPGLHRHHRQPHPRPELQRHGRSCKDKEVTPADVARVVETAKAINISTDQRLLLVEPQEFVIDGQDVKEPIGMSGIRLEAKVHIVTGAQSAAENIIKCVRRCGLEVEQLVLNPWPPASRC